MQYFVELVSSIIEILINPISIIAFVLGIVLGLVICIHGKRLHRIICICVLFIFALIGLFTLFTVGDIHTLGYVLFTVPLFVTTTLTIDIFCFAKWIMNTTKMKKGTT